MLGLTSPRAALLERGQVCEGRLGGAVDDLGHDLHSANLAWIGVVVTVGSVYVWRGSRRAILFSALIAGLSDVMYFFFVDLPGYADPPGPQMTYICAAAIATGLYAYFKGTPNAATSAAS